MKRAYKTIVDLIPDAQHFAATVLLGELESWGAIIGQMGVEAAVDDIITISEREAATTGGLWPCTDEWVPDFRADMVRVEVMPRQYRASHEAAGNSGSYPGNGSLRLLLERSCAERLIEYDPEWARIIGDA